MIKLIDFSKLVVLNCCLFLIPTAYSQIIVNDEDDSDTSSVVDEFSDVVSESEVYFGVYAGHTDRVLTVNEGLFAGNIEEREGEEPVTLTSFFLGMRSEVSKKLSLDIGIGFTRNGERFSLNEADSLYEYENTYRHLAFPIQLAYTSGEKSGLFVSGGIIPKAFLSQKQDLKYRDAEGSLQEEEIIEKEGFESFYFDMTAAAGWRFEFSDAYGLYLLGRSTYQLTNNYNKQAPFVRNPWTVGIHVGFQVYL